MNKKFWELMEKIEGEIKDWRRVSGLKETPKLEGEQFENGWRLGINRVCNSIEKILEELKQQINRERKKSRKPS